MRILYRSPDEVEAWKARDAIGLIEAIAFERGLVTREEFEAIKAETRADIEAAVAFAEASPHPDPADILDNVYSV